MVDLQGQIVPTSEAEYELLKELYDVTAEAKSEGVETADIATTLQFVAVSIMAYEGDEMPEQPEPPDDDVTENCPECGESIEDVLFSIGEQASIRPCGHEVDVSDVSGWVGR